jgi:hypothetical protein
MAAEIQLPPDFRKDSFRRNAAIIHRATAPVISLTAV